MPNLSGSLILVSGSLNLTSGSIIITSGSINITEGGLTVSGSPVVTSTDTGSFITSTDTGSFVTNSQTGSFVTNANTGSFVTNSQTGSMSVALATNAGAAAQVYTERTNTNGSYKVLFTDNINTDDNSNIYKEQDSTFTYNPGLNQLTISGSQVITGSVNISQLLTLGATDPLPSVVNGSIAFSSSGDFYFGSGSAWNKLTL